jgi:acyl-coenzyme A thioesterase PaaI-like protein
MTEAFRFAPQTVTDSGLILCSGCTPARTCRLGIQGMRATGPDEVTFELACASEYEGTGGVAHGAWIAAVMDEAVGGLPQSQGVSCVTASLTVDYLAPVPLERPLVLASRVESREARRWSVVAELRLSSTGPVLARARARMVHPDPEHFARYRVWLAEHGACTPTDSSGQSTVQQ